MMYLRSILFVLVFYLSSAVIFVLWVPTLFMPYRATMTFPIVWTGTATFLLRIICGIKINVEGLNNLPTSNGYIVASKHESALDTLLFHRLVPNVFYVFKRELLFLPFANLYALKTGCIPINRHGGGRTLKKLLTDAKIRFQQGKNMIIFPEGTRVPPDKRNDTPYPPGIAFLYENCNVPVVPVALNCGYCWPKNKIEKRSGILTIRFLPPILPGMEKRAFLKHLQDTIENEQAKLPLPFKDNTK